MQLCFPTDREPTRKRLDKGNVNVSSQRSHEEKKIVKCRYRYSIHLVESGKKCCTLKLFETDTIVVLR